MNNLKKNDELVANIIDYGANGEGIAKIDGFTIFVSGALKNEKCKIKILKVNKNFAFAKVIEVIEKSDKRVKPDCNTYPRCGGCNLRHISYDETLNIKQEKVQNLINKFINHKIYKDEKQNQENNNENISNGEEKEKSNFIKVNETIGMNDPFYYRNKAIFPVSEDKKPGIFASRSHVIIPFKECKIQTKLSQQIAKFICENWNGTIYNEKTGKETLRNIMIREAFKTGEVMVVLVENKYDKDGIDINPILSKFPMIKTIVVNENTKNTNVVLADKNIVLYGEGYITDILGDKKFKISPNSFYQVNPVQTEKIYELAIKEAKLNKEDILCDLYSGIGTIGIFSSDSVKKVYGIEIVKQAVEDARENAKINNINNIEFIEGDVESAFQGLLEKNIRPNVVIVDPPRKGLDNKTIENLNKLKLEKVIYVSCNPATLARDLQMLSSNYNIKSITPIDNFPYTSHVECVTVLNKKK